MYGFSAGLKRNAPFLQLFKKYAEKPAFAQLLYRAAFNFCKAKTKTLPKKIGFLECHKSNLKPF